MNNPTCGVCGKSDVRIYRPYGNVYRPEDNRCNACLTSKDFKWYIPLILDSDGSIYGYGAIPVIGWTMFDELAEASPDGPTWKTDGFTGGMYSEEAKE